MGSNGAILPKIASHGFDFGIGAFCAAIEGLALYGAGQCKETETAAEKAKKYTLIALAVIGALGATLAGSIAIGGASLTLGGLQAAQWSSITAVILSLFIHVQAFKALLPAGPPHDPV